MAIERRITSSRSPEGSGRNAIIADLQAARGRDVVLHAQPGDDVMDALAVYRALPALDGLVTAFNGPCASAATVIASPRTSGSPPARDVDRALPLDDHRRQRRRPPGRRRDHELRRRPLAELYAERAGAFVAL